MEFEIHTQSDRRAIRHEIALECHVVAEHGFRDIGGPTLDVSIKGVRVRSDAQVDVGEPVILTIRLPHTRTYVDAQGRVARVERGVRDGDHGRAIAIEFTAMDPVDRAMLDGAIQALPPSLPRRHLRKDYAGSLRSLVG